VLRRGLDAIVGLVARLAVRLATRSLEIHDRDRIPTDRPVLVVANHFNGFVDPLVVVAVLGRVPRFLGKATLWKILPVRPFLALAGVIPVYRAEDGATDANVRTFVAAESALVRRQTVAIFPEGTTHDEPRLAEVRTGAARIALGARAAGAKDLVILPIGLMFEDKVALRTRVFARVGRPIMLDGVLPTLVDPGEPEDESNHDLVRAVTAVLTERLQDVSPDYDDRWAHAELALAADVSLRHGRKRRDDPALGEREELAQLLADKDDGTVRAAVQRYAAHLHLLDVDDVVPAGGVVGLVSQLVRVGIALAVGYLLLAPGLVSSIIPAALVAVAGAQPAAPVTKGTVRVLTGMLAFLVAWGVSCYLVTDTALSRVTWFAYQVAAALLALPIIDASIRWYREARSWYHLRERRGALPDLVADRTALVEAVAAHR
jgi:1-acyl-sn-glycerol-3-phosphate acyltransferase